MALKMLHQGNIHALGLFFGPKLKLCLFDLYRPTPKILHNPQKTMFAKIVCKIFYFADLVSFLYVRLVRLIVVTICIYSPTCAKDNL